MTADRQAGSVQAMSYGPFLAAAFLLWPLLALLGGQGFAPLVGLTGLAALAIARPKGLPAYALSAFAFLLWAAASEFWSPAARALMSGNLLEGTFAIKARSFIIMATAALAALTLAAVIRSPPSSRLRKVMLAGLAAHGLLLAVYALFQGPIFDVVYGSEPAARGAGVQNLNRNANAFALVLPLLAALLARRGGRIGGAGALGLIVATAGIFLLADTDAGLLAILFSLLAAAVAALFPRNGFRILLGGIAGYVAAAPLVMSALIAALQPLAPMLPGSFRSRLWSWEVVITRIAEAPVTGHGLNATTTWRTTYAAYPEWMAQLPPNWAFFPVVPGHPHNMALHVWAETGAIGAILMAMSLILLAWRLPLPEQMPPPVRLAAAGLTGAAFSFFCFAYSAWNEAFWAGVALAAAAVIAFAAREPARG
jgi:O-antigen ligase